MPDEKHGRDYELGQIEPPAKDFRQLEEYRFKEVVFSEDKAVRLFQGVDKSALLDCLSSFSLVRVGEVVQILDTQGHARPIQGHIVDINAGWLTVASILGRRATFYALTGYMIGSYQWQLEPYAKVPFDG
jgi:hypothetical protein